MKIKFAAILAVLLVFFSQSVSAQTNLVELEIVMPDSAIHGNRPLDLYVNITNNSDTTKTFDAQIWVGGEAWGKQNYPYTFSDGTEVYWLVCRDGCVFSWRGTIDSGKTVSFSLPTFTSSALGTFLLVTADDYFQGIHETGWITLTEPSQTLPSANLVELQSAPEGRWQPGDPITWDGVWKPGTYKSFWLVVTTPNLEHVFVTPGDLTSDCGIQGLGSTLDGDYNVTWEEFLLSNQYLPEDAMGPCTISGTIQLLNSGETVNVKLTFQIGEADPVTDIVVSVAGIDKCVKSNGRVRYRVQVSNEGPEPAVIILDGGAINASIVRLRTNGTGELTTYLDSFNYDGSKVEPINPGKSVKFIVVMKNTAPGMRMAFLARTEFVLETDYNNNRVFFDVPECR